MCHGCKRGRLFSIYSHLFRMPIVIICFCLGHFRPCFLWKWSSRGNQILHGKSSKVDWPLFFANRLRNVVFWRRSSNFRDRQRCLGFCFRWIRGQLAYSSTETSCWNWPFNPKRQPSICYNNSHFKIPWLFELVSHFRESSHLAPTSSQHKPYTQHPNYSTTLRPIQT